MPVDIGPNTPLRFHFQMIKSDTFQIFVGVIQIFSIKLTPV